MILHSGPRRRLRTWLLARGWRGSLALHHLGRRSGRNRHTDGGRRAGRGHLAGRDATRLELAGDEAHGARLAAAHLVLGAAAVAVAARRRVREAVDLDHLVEHGREVARAHIALAARAVAHNVARRAVTVSAAVADASLAALHIGFKERRGKRHGSAAVEEDRAWGAAVDVGADRDVTEAIVRAGAPFLRVLDGHGRSGGRTGDSE
mmetsp:Transcript_25564/g.52907  ORF Transcript_25564/g.52907 Transcript_25564/m.52907 type:complete len:206 (+) Transcript_25564:141-758(+)